MAEQDDAGGGFLIGREDAVTIGIEESEDGLESLFPATILEDPDVGIWWNDGADALCELNRAVMEIIVAHEAAYEADHNGIGNGGVGAGNGGVDGSNKGNDAGGEDEDGDGGKE